VCRFNLRSLEDENLTIEEQFTQKQILREETEAPFRKVRIFFYGSLMASAALSSFLTILSLIATLTGRRAGNLDTIYQNLAIDLAGSIKADRYFDSKILWFFFNIYLLTMT
jgi:hypothetical protein